MKIYVFITSNDEVSVNYSLLLHLLNTEHKPSVKKRSTGVDFEFYRSSRENSDRFHLWIDEPYCVIGFRDCVET